MAVAAAVAVMSQHAGPKLPRAVAQAALPPPSPGSGIPDPILELEHHTRARPRASPALDPAWAMQRVQTIQRAMRPPTAAAQQQVALAGLGNCWRLTE